VVVFPAWTQNNKASAIRMVMEFGGSRQQGTYPRKSPRMLPVGHLRGKNDNSVSDFREMHQQRPSTQTDTHTHYSNLWDRASLGQACRCRENYLLQGKLGRSIYYAHLRCN
jgi:hypothetical protein